MLTSVNQPKAWMLVALVGLSNAPRTARIARGVALGLVSRDFVHAAEALGEKRSRVIVAEVLPNMNAPLLAEAGLRLTFSIALVAALGFLGLHHRPECRQLGADDQARTGWDWPPRPGRCWRPCSSSACSPSAPT